ncbi:YfiT family bacillithiol transferase [Paenibacillus arenosi]|uniref:Putative metal-dependent hydrolase IFO66_01355 n=1 Tax=Paenibacillus arenosi TaxID=2774142 RepID=A0ABR9AUN0_9BACL|nr:bacillithiol transferase BstA [Paenibacillus arenosi]MBD8496942.1 bacillithiol transferase BstA [Paenibacillus arenosi]
MNRQYPIGTFTWEGTITPAQRQQWIAEIEHLPAKLRALVEGLNEQQLETPYREGGWTIRQVVHHIADSHMNSITRFKLALTEDVPTIKPYDEAKWVALGDSIDVDVEVSLALIEALHRKWVILLQSMTEQDFQRTFYHPDSKQEIRLDYNVGLYAWHGNHHAAHIELAKQLLN